MMSFDVDHVNSITRRVIGAAIKVHKALGPGLLESVYQACLVFELLRMGLRVQTNVPLPVIYDDVRLDVGFRLDILVEDFLVLEIQSVKELADIHDAQVLTYLKRRINPHPAERFVGLFKVSAEHEEDELS